MRRSCLFCLLAVAVFCSSRLPAQTSGTDPLQVSPPTMRRVEPPPATASSADLEHSGDSLRAEKNYLDALDYYHAALTRKLNVAALYNKVGITELMMQRYKEAKKNFERAIKSDRKMADAYNNLGVVYYEMKNYGKAIKNYKKAIELRADGASFFSNLGAAYFSRKDFENAVMAYHNALVLDPEILERTSRAGITAQLPSPEDRAHYDYVMAKLYAKMGIADRSLEHLRRAMEEGYKDIANVYKDSEFTGLRQDPRFTELMAAKVPAIPE
jgi:tetratricopeptide (TPR) repeat protein